jgi:hypothetical protein
VTSYGAALAAARAALKAAGIASAALDARLLMADAAGLDIATLIARADDREGVSPASPWPVSSARRNSGACRSE